MKIYTYYENVGKEGQQELLELWQMSWDRQGFEPIILNRSHAENFKLYEEYYNFILEVHRKASNHNLEDLNYAMAAQLEFAAFATINEPSFFSDYDVINIKYKPFSPDNKVHWRDGSCTCFSTGGKSGWEEYISFLFDNIGKVIDHCSGIYQKTKRVRFHDQDFLQAVWNLDTFKDIANLTSNRKKTCASYDPILNKHMSMLSLTDWRIFEDISEVEILHLSNGNCNGLLQTYDELKSHSQISLRLAMAKQILGLI